MLLSLAYHDELAMVSRDAYCKAYADGLAEDRGQSAPDRTSEDEEIVKAATCLRAYGRTCDMPRMLEDPDFRHEILAQYCQHTHDLDELRESLHGRSAAEVFDEEYSAWLSQWLSSRGDTSRIAVS